MTDEDVMLANAALFLLPYLEKEKAKRVDEVIMLHRGQKETRDKLSEITVLTDLHNSIKGKQTTYQQRGRK